MLIVTGATGLLGNTVVRRALARGFEVTALVRGSSAERPLEGLPVRRMALDLAFDPLEAVIRRDDIVVHAAARVAIGRRDLPAFRQDNVVPTRRLAAACRAAGARLVHVSTVDTLVWGTRERPGDETPAPVDAIPTSYSMSKREAEQVVADEMAGGLDSVIVHPAFMLGPNDWKPSSGRMLLEAARAPILPAPPGGNDFCHVEDVADAVITAGQRGVSGSRYILGGEALTYAEAFALMRQVVGRSPRIAPVPAWLVRWLGRIGDGVGAITGREPALNSASAAVACRPHHFSSARATRDLGYHPRPAVVAMRDAWSWFTSHGYA